MNKRKEWIRERLNEGKIVQIAVSHTNTCYWPYLTTSGQVCRKEYGYVEDCIDWSETYDRLPVMSFKRICRYQGILQRLYNG
jgi:hypothetical protein